MAVIGMGTLLSACSSSPVRMEEITGTEKGHWHYITELTADLQGNYTFNNICIGSNGDPIK